MALTRAFKEVVADRAARDPEFRVALLTEAADLFLSGDVDTGKAVLRDFINATIGFVRLSETTGISAKSLMRMLGPEGNPSIRNLSTVFEALQKAERLTLAVRAVSADRGDIEAA
ncbi:MAG: transcriptional regulator [Siculibacillus sp.]|nr:transcriptional regulator [Siculibacillus sp.]